MFYYIAVELFVQTHPLFLCFILKSSLASETTWTSSAHNWGARRRNQDLETEAETKVSAVWHTGERETPAWHDTVYMMQCLEILPNITPRDQFDLFEIYKIQKHLHILVCIMSWLFCVLARSE